MCRRRRVASIEKQIADKVRVIQRDGMAEIMRTAALIQVGEELAKLRQILEAVGVGASNPVRNAVLQGTNGPPSSPSVGTTPAIQPACAYCGRESIYRTKVHKFNRTGTWLCKAHLPLRAQHESSSVSTSPEGVVEDSGTGGTSVNSAPLPADRPDTGTDVTASDAFAALGITTNAQ